MIFIIFFSWFIDYCSILHDIMMILLMRFLHLVVVSGCLFGLWHRAASVYLFIFHCLIWIQCCQLRIGQNNNLFKFGYAKVFSYRNSGSLSNNDLFKYSFIAPLFDNTVWICVFCFLDGFIMVSFLLFFPLMFLLKVAQVCTNCGVRMGEYFCSICKFFDDDVMTLTE